MICELIGKSKQLNGRTMYYLAEKALGAGKMHVTFNKPYEMNRIGDVASIRYAEAFKEHKRWKNAGTLSAKR